MAYTTVKINRLGQVQVEGHEYTGTDCKQAAECVENAFRGGEKNTVEKPEMHHTIVQENEGTDLTLEGQ